MSAARGRPAGAARWLGSLLLAAAAAAQGAAAPANAALHHAWLAETLDLDTAQAVAGYAAVAADPRPDRLERWVAAGRLLELRRLGATTAAVPAAADAPAPLRDAWQQGHAAIAPADLLERARRPAGQGLPSLAGADGKPPALRPVVPTAEAWVLGQIGPSQRDRIRQRLQQLAARSRESDADANRFAERIYATAILRAELEGRRSQADAARSLRFSSWQPPAADGEPAALLARIRTNLDAWQRERELTTQQKDLLQGLREAVERLAQTDPAGAVALVRRLPVYGERLLAASAPQGR